MNFDGKRNSKDIKRLDGLAACYDSLNYLSKQESFQVAWDRCDHPDWLIWLLGRTGFGKPDSAEHRKFFFCLAECLSFYPPLLNDEERTEVDGWLNELIQYGAGDIDTGEVSEAPDDRYGLFSPIERALPFSHSYSLWESLRDLKFQMGSKDSFLNFFSDDLEKKAGKKICNIIRRYYPQPPKF